jgi:hypothetical protein
MLIVDAKAASSLSIKRLAAICVHVLAFRMIHLASIGTVFVLLFGIAVRGVHSIMQLFELQPGFTYALLQVCRVMCDMQRVMRSLFQLFLPIVLYNSSRLRAACTFLHFQAWPTTCG